MTDIEQKALALVNRIALDRNTHYPCVDRANDSRWEALCRALEAHEADKSRHAAELREQAERFSEAAGKAVPVIEMLSASMIAGVKKRAEVDAAIQALTPYLTAPVDPLVEAVTEMLNLPMALTDEQAAHHLRDALDARGLAIVKKEAVNGVL